MPRVRGVTLAALIVLPALLLAAACGPVGGSTDDGAGSGRDSHEELVVLAASSLTEVLEVLAQEFAASEGGVPVRLSLAGSQTLAAQLLEGAPADVFVSADATRMEVVVDADLVVGDPVVIATNGLAIVFERGNPLGVAGLADLARPDLVVVLAAEESPIGRYARAALARAGVVVAPASLEPDVRAALAKVELGEADATIVYASDLATAAGRVDGMILPADVDVRATYPAAALVGAPSPAAAARFVAFLRSPRAQQVLRAHGFGLP